MHYTQQPNNGNILTTRNPYNTGVLESYSRILIRPTLASVEQTQVIVDNALNTIQYNNPLHEDPIELLILYKP